MQVERNGSASANVIAFAVEPTAPFRLDLTAWTLRRRPENQVDRWDGGTYRRALVLRSEPIELAVRQSAGGVAPRLEVTVKGAGRARELETIALRALERLLGIRVDLGGFYRIAARDRRLARLMLRFRGAKPPRFPTLFEALVNAVACQQLTLAVGIVLLNRLAETYGLAVREQYPSVHAFPRPEDLAGVSPESLRRLGFSRQKSRALLELAQTAIEGRLDEERFAALDDETAVARLCELRGIGRWSAEYALLRGLGRTRVFPGDDVGARNHLEHWLRLRKPLDYDGVQRVLGKWRSCRGLVYFHLLLERLMQEGSMPAGMEENMYELKRVYEPLARRDGARFLVERLWPRGMRKESLKMDAWLKDVAPSDALRRWFGHDPTKWKEFRRRYFAELDERRGALEPILDAGRRGNVTLLYSARDTEHNNAIALKEFLERPRVTPKLVGAGKAGRKT